MALELRVSTKQTQNLVITPQMQQALKLLQLSNVELNNYLSEEVEKNPFLELDGDTSKIAKSAESQIQESTSFSQKNGDLNNDQERISSDQSDSGVISNSQNSEHGVSDKRFDEWNEPDFGSAREEEGANAIHTIVEQTIEEDVSLSVHLEKQLRIEKIDQNIREIAIALLGWLGDDGYLREKDEVLSESLGTEIHKIQRARNAIQSLEPVGVGAFDAKECFALQLNAQNKLTETFKTLLENLHMIEHGEIQKLKKICKIDEAELRNLIGQLRSLDPFPGRKLDKAVKEPKQPDLLVKETAEGWKCEVNEATLPRMMFLDRYWEELARRKQSSEDKKFLNECHRSGKWLDQALHHRTATMKRVGDAILKKQESFFDRGIENLTPMTMKDIANDLEVHESTISRVISNKLLECPRGIFELKFFFTQGLKSSSGATELSSETVKNKIRKIIGEEPNGKPISDTKITVMLEENGITIARRTVAKYRENLGIPPASARRVKQILG